MDRIFSRVNGEIPDVVPKKQGQTRPATDAGSRNRREGKRGVILMTDRD
jgi:hypothetical protein